jgi:hypothetical protein
VSNVEIEIDRPFSCLEGQNPLLWCFGRVEKIRESRPNSFVSERPVCENLLPPTLAEVTARALEGRVLITNVMDEFPGWPTSMRSGFEEGI